MIWVIEFTKSTEKGNNSEISEEDESEKKLNDDSEDESEVKEIKDEASKDVSASTIEKISNTDTMKKSNISPPKQKVTEYITKVCFNYLRFSKTYKTKFTLSQSCYHYNYSVVIVLIFEYNMLLIITLFSSRQIKP